MRELHLPSARSALRRKMQLQQANTRASSRGASHFSRGAMNRPANSQICPAPADIPGQSAVNILIAGTAVARQQNSRRHHLAGLAVATLRDLFGDPGFLYGVAVVARKTLDCRDAFIGNLRNRGDARSYGAAVKHDCTGAAMGNPAAKLRASQSKGVAENP